MSHGLFGLGGATFTPASACCAVVDAAPITASASATITAISILIFMRILSALANSRFSKWADSSLRHKPLYPFEPCFGNTFTGSCRKWIDGPFKDPHTDGKLNRPAPALSTELGVDCQ